MPDMTKLQTVLIELSNGVKGKFSGPAICDPDVDSVMNVTIKDIKFTIPRDLPEGFTWVTGGDEKDTAQNLSDKGRA